MPQLQRPRYMCIAQRIPALTTSSRGRASRSRCRGTGRRGCCAASRAASRGACRRRSGRAEIRPRHTYRRVLRRDGAIDAGDG